MPMDLLILLVLIAFTVLSTMLLGWWYLVLTGLVVVLWLARVFSDD